MKRIISMFMATIMLMSMMCVSAYAATPTLDEDVNPISSMESDELAQLFGLDASYHSLGVASSGPFYYNTRVTVSISDSIYSKKADIVGIYIVDKTNTSVKGAEFTITSTVLSNSITYIVGSSSSYSYYNLGTKVGGGQSATFTVQLGKNGDMAHQYEAVIALFYQD